MFNAFAKLCVEKVHDRLRDIYPVRIFIVLLPTHFYRLENPLGNSFSDRGFIERRGVSIAELLSKFFDYQSASLNLFTREIHAHPGTL